MPFAFVRNNARSSAPATRRSRTARVRLFLEALEDRRVPTTFVVNSLLDGAPAVDGQLTLREAVTAAVTNAPSGDAPAGSVGLDSITFASSLDFGIISLQSGQGELLLSGGGDVRIAGPVAGNAQGITISGQNLLRVVHVTTGASAVTLDSLTLKKGNTDIGGGLFNEGSNTTLTSVDLFQNTASIVGGGLENTGRLTMNRCTVSNNTAGSSGGIGNDGSSAVLFVTVSGILGNASSNNGGGLLNTGAVTMLTTTIAGNLATGDGGGLFNAGGGQAQMSLARCTISANRAGGAGGGARNTNQFSHLTFLNSTIVENTGEGGGIMNDGGAFLDIANCTVVHNADTSNNANGSGGIAAKESGFSHLDNTIVSLNDAGPACANPNVNGTATSSHANFIGGDPRLSPLQDHGGPTLTMAPLAGSPVIDAGDDAFEARSKTTSDQRGGPGVVDGDQNGSLVIDQGAVEFSPGPINPIVAAADRGSAPEVKVYGGIHGALRYDFLAYPAGFTGGVRVAVGDVTGDGVADYVTGAGPGGGPQVNLFNGANGSLVKAFMAFAPTFSGGVFVAVGDVNNDGFAEVVVGADAGAAPSVAVFDGKSLAQGTKTLLAAFSAYDASFTGGVRVAVGDVNDDHFADVVTGKGPGAAPRVRVFDGKTLSSISQTLLFDFMAYATSFTGGVYVASGDTNGDGDADIITGAGAGGGPQVNVFSGVDGLPLASFFAYGVNFGGGVRVSAADLNGDGLADIITGRGPGGEPTVKVFDGQSLAQGLTALDRFDAFDLAFTGGVFVGGA